MSAEILPHYDYQFLEGNRLVEASLHDAGWATNLRAEDDTTYLFAGRQAGVREVYPGMLQAKIQACATALSSPDEFTVATAGEGSLFEGRTVVTYRGNDLFFFNGLIRELLVSDEEASRVAWPEPQHTASRKWPTLGAVSALAIGAAYAYMRRR